MTESWPMIACYKCGERLGESPGLGHCEECNGLWCPDCWSTVQALQPDGDPFEPGVCRGCRREKQVTPARLKATFDRWDPRLENTSAVALNVSGDVPYVFRTYRRGETVPALPLDMLVLTADHARRLFEFEEGPLS